MSILTFTGNESFRWLSDTSAQQISTEAPAFRDGDMMPFEQMATPELDEAICALRALQTAARDRHFQATLDLDVVEGAEDKLRRRMCAAAIRSNLPGVQSVLREPVRPRVSSVCLVLPRESIEIAVDSDVVDHILPHAADIIDGTGVHLVAECADDLTPAELKGVTRRLVAEEILAETQAGEAAKHELAEEVVKSSMVPALSVEELRCLRGALRRQSLHASSRADRWQARIVQKEFGFPLPSVPSRLLGAIARRIGLYRENESIA